MPRPGAPARHPARPSWGRWIARGAIAALAAVPLWLATWRVLQLIQVLWGRVDYPMDLEWMEGGQLLHAHRLLHGQPVYGDCLDGFIAFPYPPVHIAILAAAGAIFGLDYPVGRSVSIIALSLSCLILSREVVLAGRARAEAWLMAVLSLGAIAGSFTLVGAWYDVIRVDSVFVALLLAGALLALPPHRSGDAERALSPTRIALGAVTLTAAIYAKQTAIFFLPWIGLWAIWRDRRSGLRLCLLLGALCVVMLGILLWSTDGRFWTYLITIMSRHRMGAERSLFNGVRLLLIAPFLPAVPVLALWLWRKGALRARTGFWLGMLICALAASLITTTKAGAHLNNLMSAAMLSWPATMLVVIDWQRHVRKRPVARYLWAGCFCLLATGPLHILKFIPKGWIPHPGKWRSAVALNRFVASKPGGVLFPAHPFIPVRNGLPHRQFHRQGYVDPMEASLREFDYVQCFQGVDAEWLIIGAPPHPYFQVLMLTAYEPVERLPPLLRTEGGYGTPDWLMRRRKHMAGTAPRTRQRVLFDFETGAYDGWTSQGDAFGLRPASGQRGEQFPVLGFGGRWFASSYDPVREEEATGQLRSEEFVIDRSHLGFRVGGGFSQAVRVELEVDGEIVRSAGGAGMNADLLVHHEWDVSSLAAKRARIILTDDERGYWGHLLADDFELFDLADR